MIKSLNVTELSEMLNLKKNFILVDCREQEEWDLGHLPKAILIPLSSFNEDYPSELTDTEQTIVMQCRSGKRSFKACQMLLEEGFSDLYNLEGGILAWEEAGLPIFHD